MLAVVTASCGTDDPSCFFGPGSCQGGGTGGFAGEAATLPFDGAWILDAAPLLEQFRPNGNGAHARTPITLRFSESIAAESLGGSLTSAFELVEINGSGAPVGFPTVFSQTLKGDGRMLVLLPTQALKAGATYQIRYRSDAKVKDLTGQLIVKPADNLIGSFSVAQTNPVEPKVLTTFPADDAVNQGWSPEVVVVFDQPIDAATVTSESWIVTVDAAAPAFDPDPAPYTVLNPLDPLNPSVDTRVWTWKSVDDDGVATLFGPSADYKFELSPLLHPIANADDGELPATIVTFEGASFDAPQAASLLSAPTDAIGIPNLTPGSGNELSLGAQLSGAQSGDVVTLILFGTSLGTPPKLAALLRQKVLSSSPFDSVIVAATDFDLTSSTSPLKALYADGSLTVALRLKRGTTVSPVRLLDVDLDIDGAQSPLLDTLAPTLVELDTSGGSTAAYRSDLRGLSVAGTASEPPSRVTVVTSLGDNLAHPEVYGAASNGTFLASPVDGLDLLTELDLPLDYTVTVYDSALNASTPVVGQYRQVGAVGPGGHALGDPLEVEVFDADTLQPIEGALVMTHADDGATWPLVESALTPADGRVTIASDSQYDTLLTVDAPDIGTANVVYDLFTLQGVTSNRLSIPLRRSALTPTAGSATVGGSITSSGSIAALTLSLLGRRVSDTRRDPFEPRTLAGAVCTSNPFGGGALNCPFGPYTVRANQLGAATMLAGTFTQTQPAFSAAGLIQAFELELPRPRLAGGGSETFSIDVPKVLSEPGTPVADLPVQAPNANFFAFFTTGIDLAHLVDDGALVGAPLVTIEGLVAGLPGSIVVGLGLAYDQGSLLWALRSAYAGQASVVGDLVADGILDADLLLRGEIRDTAGNVCGQRRRLSNLGLYQPFPNHLFPANVAQVLSPLAGATTADASYTLTIDNSVQDLQQEAGLYRVTLRDAAGRRWTLVRTDPNDAAGATLDLRVVDVAAAGGQALQAGTIEAVVESLAWPSLDPSAFFWSDLEREYDVFSRSAVLEFTQP
jgi:hypothetical protein